MAKMYEKLAELLSETLEKGSVNFFYFDKDKKDELDPDVKKILESPENENPISEKSSNEIKVENHISKKRNLFEVQFLSMSDDEKRAARLLELELPFDKEKLNSAYKEKLKYYHPDFWSKNEVLAMVAHKKTQEIINANKVLNSYLKKQN